ncbi:hypothetical protein E2320_020960 [Naja naja]|nr:hypothetical protein E2320_020960 [Naja naja]
MPHEQMAATNSLYIDNCIYCQSQYQTCHTKISYLIYVSLYIVNIGMIVLTVIPIQLIFSVLLQAF